MLDVKAAWELAEIYSHLQLQDEDLDEAGDFGVVGDLKIDWDLDLSGRSYHQSTSLEG